MANHTILLIDYEPRSIERFRQPLTGAGYRVEIATDGIAGVEAFTRLSPDMVLVEAMIPKKHGFEVCQELKRTPHGRRTPIIITTGVYKGRKYRTQALHIYGCDEYIEKPIAAEQLLAIVDRFLAGTAPSTREPVAAGVDASEAASAVSIEPPRSAPEPAPTRPGPHKPPVPKAVVADLTEDEIMARLDAILPVASPVAAQPGPEPQESILETLPEEPSPIVVASDPEPVVEADPFKQMQEELTAELGSLSGALALDRGPEPMLSDQAPAPPLLESLPEPEAESIPLALGAPLPAPGQVVSFDAKRSRKSKKAGRKQEAAAAATSPAPPPAARVSPEPRAPREIGIPSGTLVESALESERKPRGVPAWLWIVGLAIVLVAVYFVFWQGGSATTRTSPEPRRASAPEPAPVVEEPSPEPVASLEPAAPASSGPTKSKADADAKLVLNAVGPPPARTAPPAASEPKTSAKQPAKSISEWRPSRREQESIPVAPPSAPAGLGLGAADVGVESIAEAVPAAAPTPRPTTAAGALVDLSEVDSAPASLSRKLPAYSMQARQLKLQGTVVMKVLVNERGTVDQVVVVSGIDGAGLTEATVKAARQWTYRPAVKDGVPVKVWTTEQVTFKI